MKITIPESSGYSKICPVTLDGEERIFPVGEEIDVPEAWAAVINDMLNSQKKESAKPYVNPEVESYVKKEIEKTNEKLSALIRAISNVANGALSGVGYTSRVDVTNSNHFEEIRFDEARAKVLLHWILILAEKRDGVWMPKYEPLNMDATHTNIVVNSGSSGMELSDETAEEIEGAFTTLGATGAEANFGICVTSYIDSDGNNVECYGIESEIKTTGISSGGDWSGIKALCNETIIPFWNNATYYEYSDAEEDLYVTLEEV